MMFIIQISRSTGATNNARSKINTKKVPKDDYFLSLLYDAGKKTVPPNTYETSGVTQFQPHAIDMYN